MNFDLLSLKLATTKIDSTGISNLRAELENRRKSKTPLSIGEKTHVCAFIQSNVNLAEEDTSFHTMLVRLLGYVNTKA